MKRIKQEHGVVMMETLLALPICFVLLAGLFWLGEVCMVRLALIGEENVTLWAKGNRHEADSFPYSYYFWFVDPQGKTTVTSKVSQDNFSASSAANGWGEITQGNLKGEVKRSEISFSMADTSRALFDFGDETPGSTSAAVTAKGGNVKILSRAASARQGSASYNGSSNWRNIAVGGWASFITPSSPGSAIAIVTYNRDSNYNTWSL